jgi:hypothetical protein
MSGATASTKLVNQYSRGLFTIQNQATGYGIADYMLRYVYQNRDSVGLFRATSQSYFAADTWKVRSNLTIDLGLRQLRQYFDALYRSASQRSGQQSSFPGALRYG